MMLSNEKKLLAWIGQLEPDDKYLQKIRDYMSNGIETDHLIDLAVKEGLAGFLYKNLRKADLLEMLKPHHKQRLYTTYYLTIRHNLKLIHALNEIIKPLIQRQVQVILLQGISLLQQVYRDIGLRPMNDMDFWVLPNQYADLVDCMVSQGFVRSSNYPNTFSKGEVVLDIHTQIFWEDRILRRNSLINSGQEEIYKNAQLINSENSAALCLNPSDHFLYMSQHALKHNLERLIWLVDIKSLVAEWEPKDWRALMIRTEELGQQATLFYMLFVLTNIFKPKLPSEILSYLGGWKPNFFERKALSRRISGSPMPIWSHLVLFSAGNGLHERISVVKETLFTRKKVLRQVFPAAANLSDRQLNWKRVLQILGSFKYP